MRKIKGWVMRHKWIVGVLLVVGGFLALQVTITAQSTQTMRTIFNNVWDKANHRLMTTPGVGAQGVTETEQTILNDVWDSANNMLRVSGGGGAGGGDLSSNTATSVDSEAVLFSGTTGKIVKRATGTGVAHLTGGVLSAAPVNLSTESTGNLSVTQLAGGSGATSSTFWRGDGTWSTPAGGGGGGHVIQNEATPLAAQAALNFTGAGVDCVDNAGAGRTDCTIGAVASSAGIPVFNVKDYGATGDGTTNDTAAITATITAAGNNAIVYFPAGTYSTFIQYHINKTGLTFRGQGHSSLLKRRDDGINTSAVLMVEDSFDITVEYLAVDVNNCLSYCSGIEIRETPRFRVQYNRVFDSNLNAGAENTDKFGITIQGPVAVQDIPGYVLYNVLEDTQLEIDRASNILIQGNKVIRPRSTAGIGVFTNVLALVSGNRNISIVDNVVQDADVSGGAITVHIDPANQSDFVYSDVIIARNIILYHTDSAGEERNGIRIGTGNSSTTTTGNIFRNFLISGNYIWAHPTVYAPDSFYGINLSSGPAPAFVFDKFVIEGNSIVLPNAPAYGMNFRMLENSVVRNNSVYNVADVGSGGMILVRGKHVKIYENEVYGSAGKGFNFTPVAAYDMDIRSWKNIAVGVTSAFYLNDPPTAQYALEDFTAAGVFHGLSAASETISTWAGVMKVDLSGAGAPLTMTSTPTFMVGRDGQRVTIVNMDDDQFLTLQDERVVTGTKLYLRESAITLGPFDMMSFVYSGDLAGWVQDSDGAVKDARVIAQVDDGDVTINANTTDIATIDNLTNDNGIFRNPSGTYIDGAQIVIRVGSATPMLVRWGGLWGSTAAFSLPTVTTGGGVVDYWTFRYNAFSTMWELVGNTSKKSVVYKIWLPLASCQNVTAALLWDVPVSSAPVASCATGVSVQKGVADFANSLDLTVQMTLALPDDWSSAGVVSAKVKWFSSQGTTENVMFKVGTACTADGEEDVPSFVLSSVLDAAKATANQVNDAVITPVSMTGCAAGELLHVQFGRYALDAGDLHNNAVRVIGVELTLSRIAG